jgi:hypothetical protein
MKKDRLTRITDWLGRITDWEARYVAPYRLYLIVGGITFGAIERFTPWQICIFTLLLILVATVIRPVHTKQSVTLATLSRQLSNIYVLLAWNAKRVPNENLENISGGYESTEFLLAWKRFNKYRFQGNGMTLEEADMAACDEHDKHRRMIALYTLERIERGCNRKRSHTDPEPEPPLPRKALCPQCEKNYWEFEKRLREALARDKAGDTPFEWGSLGSIVPCAPCPLPGSDTDEDYNE